MTASADGCAPSGTTDADFEIGGQWVSPDQDALVALLDELGLDDLPALPRTATSLYIDPRR